MFCHCWFGCGEKGQRSNQTSRHAPQMARMLIAQEGSSLRLQEVGVGGGGPVTRSHVTENPNAWQA